MSCDEKRREESSKPRADAMPADSKIVPPVSLGQILLEKYRIESLIGTGGIGFVMSAAAASAIGYDGPRPAGFVAEGEGA